MTEIESQLRMPRAAKNVKVEEEKIEATTPVAVEAPVKEKKPRASAKSKKAVEPSVEPAEAPVKEKKPSSSKKNKNAVSVLLASMEGQAEQYAELSEDEKRAFYASFQKMFAPPVAKEKAPRKPNELWTKSMPVTLSPNWKAYFIAVMDYVQISMEGDDIYLSRSDVHRAYNTYREAFKKPDEVEPSMFSAYEDLLNELNIPIPRNEDGTWDNVKMNRIAMKVVHAPFPKKGKESE